MSPKVDQLLLNSVIQKLSESESPTSIRKYISEKTGLGKTQSGKIFNDISSINKIKCAEEPVQSNTDNFSIVEINADEQELSVSHFGLKTLDELLDRCGIDKKEWDVKSFRPNSWPSNTKDHGVVIFSQVKAYLERKITRRARITIEDLKKDMMNVSPVVEAKNYQPLNNGRLLEICAPDLHLGKYGESDEVGTEYNSGIAEDIFFNAVSQIVDRASKQGSIQKIVLPIGNDFFNIDTKQKTTTAGTPQDCDISFSKIFRRGRILLVRVIDFLSSIAPVDVVVVSGNHETTTMIHLGDCLECYYHNNPNVNVNNGFKTRKYYSFGENLIIYTHGDKEKQDRLPIIAATEEPELWAASKYREIRLGHLHHEIVKEISGVKIRVVPSLSGNDAYHYERGYVENIRVAQGFIFDKLTGLEAIIYSKPVS